MSEGPWYLQRGKQRAIGPFTRDEIVEGITSGEIPPDSKVCEVDGKIWLPMETIPELRAALAATGRLPKIVESVPPPPAPKPRPGPRFDGLKGAPKAAEMIEPLEKPERIERVERIEISPRARTLVRVVGALGLVVAIARIVILIRPTSSARLLLESLHALRVEIALSAGLGVVAWSTLVGAAKETRLRASLQASLIALLASNVVSGLSLVRLARAPRFPSLDEALRRAAITIVAAPMLVSIAAAAVVLVLLRVRAREIVRVSRSSVAPLLSGVVAAPIAAVTMLAVAARVDVRILSPRSTVPVPVFVDPADLGEWVDATRAGAEGVEGFERALRAALIVDPGTPARFVDERLLVTSKGRAIAHEVEIISGLHEGRRVFVLAVPAF